MTDLQIKINTVEEYLYQLGKRDSTGKRIRIVFKNQDNTIELQKLEIAYIKALNYFKL